MNDDANGNNGNVVTNNRRRIETKDVIVVVMFALQLAGFVWGAATTVATVRGLEETLEKVEASLIRTTEQLSQLNIRVHVLEDRSKRNAP